MRINCNFLEEERILDSTDKKSKSYYRFTFRRKSERKDIMSKVVPIRPGPEPVDETTARCIRATLAIAARDSLQDYGVLTKVQGRMVMDRQVEFERKVREACLSVILEFACPPGYKGQ